MIRCENVKIWRFITESLLVIKPKDKLDEIEYSLGLDRGDIKKYYSSDLLKAAVHSDMVQLFRRGQWTLVPPVETLQAMHDLFDANHVNGTHNRTGFLDVIPEAEEYYEYRFMGLKQPGNTVFHAAGQPYAFPYRDFPIVRTRLHPCFIFPSLVPCMNIGSLAGNDHLHLIGDNIHLAGTTYLILNSIFYLSFLGNTKARDFPERRIPSVRRRDPVRPLVAAPSHIKIDEEAEPTPPPVTSSVQKGKKTVVIRSPPPSSHTQSVPVTESKPSNVIAPGKKQSTKRASPTKSVAASRRRRRIS
ncbi:hypothetical protein CPB85DRAFT_1435691 [Mucidula mucida]|nr:hypothetical protein CPB85DRAFT_1435691 [Mucidula mucida]